MKELGPNEYLGDQILPITLDNGKKKYIRLNVRKTYDNGGNFVRLSEYTMDITDEVLRNKEIAELTATVEDVQSATSFGIHYVTPDGKYHWTPECYNILEREPRPDDKYHHVLLDLLDENDRLEMKNIIDNLEPNELLGDNIIKPITLENGKKKYILFNGRKVYDEQGNFIRRSGYTQDVTRDVLKDRELLTLEKQLKMYRQQFQLVFIIYLITVSIIGLLNIIGSLNVNLGMMIMIKI